MRTCGNCSKELPIEMFYRDGLDSGGNIKYRRDCKECYRTTRFTERRAKRVPKVKVKERSRR